MRALVDIAEPEIFASGQADALLRMLRRSDPVHHHPNHRFGPFWSLTRHADVLEAQLRPDDFRSADGVTDVDWGPGFSLDMFIASDGERHRRARAIAAPTMTGAALEGLKAEMAVEVDRCLDRLSPGAELDAVAAIASPIARATAGRLFGLAEGDIAELEALTAIGHGVGRYAYSPMRERIRLLRRRAQALRPDGAPSLAFRLADGPYGALGNAVFLSSASLETTRAAIAASLLAAHLFPDQADLIHRQPERAPDFVAESLRWHAPLAYMRRTTARAVRIGGVELPAGAKVLLWYASANRDEAVFDAPGRLVLGRPNISASLSFGVGVHHCLGRRLAEHVLALTWSGLVARGMRLQLLEPPVRTPSYFIQGFDRMTVRVI